MTREDLLEKLRLSRPAVTVVGLGGAGCNITTWISEKKLAGGKIIGANTDANHLNSLTKADKIILLGEKLCKGHGCGGYPERGAQAANENLAEIKEELKGTNLLFLVAGLGGGSGTGAIPVFAAVGREVGALTIACVTIPFTIEMLRREKAREAIKSLAENCDSIVVIDNSKLREVAGNLPLKEALSVANALVGSFVKNITDTITQPSLVNLDYADLRAIMERGGIASIGIGEGDGDDRVEKAVSQALATPLLDITDISTAYGVLIHIVGGEDMTLEEVAVAGEQIMDKIPNTKRVIWGAKVDPGLSGRVRVMAVVTGVTCPFLSGIPKPVAAPAPTIPKEVAKPLREAMEHMINALPQETISRAAVFSKEK
jgi:cell division protein FtsZ